MEKIRLLVLADSPTVATGFAQVSKNILDRLAQTDRYDIHVIGINHRGDSYNREKHPYDIYMANIPNKRGLQDMYGRPRIIDFLNGETKLGDFEMPIDILFTIQDSFVIEGLGVGFPFGENVRAIQEIIKGSAKRQFRFKWVGYFPVDSDLKENWVTRAIALADAPVAYCNYGKKEIMKYDRKTFEFKTGDDTFKIESMENRIRDIPHGVDLNVFKPLPKAEIKKFREEFFAGQVKDDTTLVVNISRNQPRKDIMRTMQVFSEFKKKVPDSHLYMHMQTQDLGGSVIEMGRQFGLIIGEDFSLPVNFDSNKGYGVDMINKIYNAADLCITTTLGEGWGFISTECMAVKTPIIAPNITSFADIFNADKRMEDLNDWFYKEGYKTVRGIPVLAGSTKSEFISLGLHDNERLRPLTNIDDMVAKMLWVINNKDKVKTIVDNAYEWVQTLSWDKVVDKWDMLFTNVYNELSEERAKVDVAVTRNEPCPECLKEGNNVKWKKCSKHNPKVN